MLTEYKNSFTYTVFTMGQEGTNLFRWVILLNPYKNHRRQGTGVVNTNRTYHEHCFKHFMYLFIFGCAGSQPRYSGSLFWHAGFSRVVAPGLQSAWILQLWREGFSLVVVSGGYSSCRAQASHCSGFCCGAQALGRVGFRSCGSQALKHRFSTCGTWA